VAAPPKPAVMMEKAQAELHRAGARARACYEAQGMPDHAQRVTQVVQAFDTSAVTDHPIQPTSSLPSEAAASVSSKRKDVGMVVWLIFMTTPLFVLAGKCLSRAQPDPAPPAHIDQVRQVRRLAEFRSADLEALMKGKPVGGMDVSDMMAIIQLGPLSATDHHGRPEVEWEVPSDVCRTLVQDIYRDPSYQVAVTVDGTNVNVSCEGSGLHEIKLEPRG
jgi:hypothetical protein